jgi:hypothetical protein
MDAPLPHLALFGHLAVALGLFTCPTPRTS